MDPLDYVQAGLSIANSILGISTTVRGYQGSIEVQNLQKRLLNAQILKLGATENMDARELNLRTRFIEKMSADYGNSLNYLDRLEASYNQMGRSSTSEISNKYGEEYISEEVQEKQKDVVLTSYALQLSEDEMNSTPGLSHAKENFDIQPNLEGADLIVAKLKQLNPTLADIENFTDNYWGSIGFNDKSSTKLDSIIRDLGESQS
jgi:hypothetical protein